MTIQPLDFAAAAPAPPSAPTDDTILVRPPWARLKHCPVRDRWLLLVPERVLFPCPTTLDILQRLEQPAAFGTIVAALAQEFDAPAEVIRADVLDLLSGLMEKGYVRRAES
jgi:pyrroloquinoline quinone biosynthesis protein D